MGRFLQYTHFNAGTGSQIQLWHDYWCGDQPLQVGFLSCMIPDCSKDRKASMESLLVQRTKREIRS